MTDNFRDFFREVEPIRLKEPLAEILGAFKVEEPILEYSYADTVKMAGHACPTVKGKTHAGRKKRTRPLVKN
jgi:hypothetical protein